MKQYFKLITAGLIYTVAYTTSLHANTFLEPDYIFENQKRGKATLSHRTTNAAFLHVDNIEGQLKNGKKLTAAIIDNAFHPKYTRNLKDLGFIHPAAFSENLILDPDEGLEHINVMGLYIRVADLENPIGKNTVKNDKEIKRLNELIQRKHIYDAGSRVGSNSHGSGVMEAIHLMAPKAQLLPIDLSGISKDMKNMAPSSVLAYSIRKAIQHGADVINISRSFDVTEEVLQACKEATNRGVAIIIAAGNDSSSIWKYDISQIWDNIKNVIARNPQYDLFKSLGGKGIRFAGALEYGNTGEEQVTSYTQHPTQDTERQVIFAAGNHLPIHAKVNPDELVYGTSFAAPTVAGGYLLLKEFVLDYNYKLTTEQLLDILHDSGRDVTYKETWPLKDKTYKSLDVYKAQKHILETMKPASKEPVAEMKSASALTALVLQAATKAASVIQAVAKAAPVRPVVTKAAPVRPVVTKAAPVRPVVTKAAPVRPVVTKAAPVRPVVTKAAPVRRAVTKAAPVRRAVTKAASVRRAITRTATVRRVVKRAAPVRRAVTKAAPVRRAVTKAASTRRVVKRAAPTKRVARKHS